MKKNKEHIARGIVFERENILLCKNLKRNFHYLPGGHIEKGELLEDALRREFIEESRTSIIDTKFIETFSNEFEESNKIIQEDL